MNLRVSKKWYGLFCISMLSLLLVVGCAKREAQKTLTQAEEAKEEAQAAQAPRYSPDTFGDANNLLNQAQSQFDAGEYEDAITTAEQAAARFEAARVQVADVKSRVDQQIADIRDAIAAGEDNIQKARDEGFLDPSEMNPVAQQLDDFTTRLEDEYRNVISEQELNDFLEEIQTVVQRTEQMAVAHLEPEASEAKDEIQQMLDQAEQLNAATHVPDEYSEIQDLFSQMDSAERDGDWQVMIDLADQIRPQLDEIITIAQEKAAGEILQETADLITQAKQLNISVDAFNASIEQAEETLETGSTELENEEYAAAIAAANESQRLLDEGFQILAEQARENIDTAEANVEEAIEREAQTYAPSALQQVQESIAAIEDLLEKEEFAEAFRTSQNVVQSSQEAIVAARRGKAQQALDKVLQPYETLRSQGGEQYAPEAFAQVKDTVDTLHEMMDDGQFEEVEEEVPAAVEVVEQGLMALEESTEEIIEQAQQAIAAAEVAQSPEWVSGLYSQSQDFLEDAKQELEQDNYLSSIRKAESSNKTANEAEARAYQLQTEQNLNKSKEFLELAREADQDTLSPLAFRKAVDTREKTLELLETEEYKDAFHESEKAVQLSEDALNNLIITAREKADSALQAQAKEYSEPEMTEALSLLNQAVKAQNEQNFDEANRLAQESAELSEEAEHFTWQQRSFALLKKLEGMKEELQENLAPIKTPSLYRQALNHLTEAKVAQVDQDYALSYQEADAARNARDTIWNNMRDTLTQKATEFGDDASWIGENALNRSGRETKMELLSHVSELNRLIDLEEWAKAYEQAEKTEKVAEKAMAKVKKENRKILAQQLREDLNEFEQKNALSIVPEDSQLFQDTLDMLMSPEEGQTYAEAYQQYLQALENKDTLPETINTVALQRTEEVADVLEDAQDAGANKYYGDWLRELTKELQWLRNSIRGDDYEGIAERLQKLEKEAPELLLATQQADEEDNYLASVESALNDMNKAIQDFGYIGSMPRDIIVAARSTEHKLDQTMKSMYRSLQGEITTKNLLIISQNLEENVKDMNPPETMTSYHNKVIKSFEHFRKAAEGFHFYGQSDVHDIKYRERRLNNAFDHLYKVVNINDDLMFKIESHRKMSPKEIVDWKLKQWESEIGDFYFNYEGP